MYRPTAVISHARNATVVVLASHEPLRRSRCLAGERLLSVFAGAVKRTGAVPRAQVTCFRVSPANFTFHFHSSANDMALHFDRRDCPTACYISQSTRYVA
jgi:hypothetical protein